MSPAEALARARVLRVGAAFDNLNAAMQAVWVAESQAMLDHMRSVGFSLVRTTTKQELDQWD